jgi:hypothetical protein
MLCVDLYAEKNSPRTKEIIVKRIMINQQQSKAKKKWLNKVSGKMLDREMNYGILINI